MTYTKFKREISRLLAAIARGVLIDAIVTGYIDEMRFLFNEHPDWKAKLAYEMSRKSPLTWPV